MIASTKRTFKNDQIQIAKDWLRRSEVADPYFKFTAVFAAFNSVYWLSSDADRELAMVNDFKDKLLYQFEQLRDSETPCIESADAFIISAERFEVADLGHRRDRRPPRRKKFLDNSTFFEGIRFADLSNMEKIDVAIDLAYQFRCNLIHGTKNVSLRENELTAKAGARFLREVVAFTIRTLERY